MSGDKNRIFSMTDAFPVFALCLLHRETESRSAEKDSQSVLCIRISIYLY